MRRSESLFNISACADFRADFSPVKARNRRNPLWISRLSNAQWRKIPPKRRARGDFKQALKHWFGIPCGSQLCMLLCQKQQTGICVRINEWKNMKVNITSLATKRTLWQSMTLQILQQFKKTVFNIFVMFFMLSRILRLNIFCVRQRKMLAVFMEIMSHATVLHLCPILFMLYIMNK